MDTKMCPSCSTDLSLFSAEESTADADTEELKLSLMSDGNGYMTDLLKAAEDDATVPSPKPVEIIYEDSVECPECHKSIPADAMACPHCGVQFEMEEVFECPMCKSLLELTVTKCPSCGTEFADESVKETPPPPVEAPKPMPEPISEKKSEPMSFADRLKQVKEEPGPAPAAPGPKKELSFAERMKAMKEGKQPEEQQPVPPAQTPAEAPPKPVQTAQPKPVQAAPPQTTPGSISDRLRNLAQGKTISPVPAQTTPQPTAPPPSQARKTEPATTPSGTKEEQYKELPRYIAEVKVLLLLSNELKIDVSTSKAIINKAVSAGKSRDLNSAIRLVKEGKTGIEKELKTVYITKIRTLETALSLEKKAGKDVSELEPRLNDAKKSLESGNFQQVSDTLKDLEEVMMRTSSGKISQVEMDTVSCALDNAEFLRLNVSEAKAFYDDARIADDPQRSIHLTKQATESLNKVLPSFIAGEMRTAKITLREIKMMNVDITAPVQMLKEANDDVLRGDYCSALSHIKRFKEYVQNVEQ